jgi:hypothetical protein
MAEAQEEARAEQERQEIALAEIQREQEKPTVPDSGYTYFWHPWFRDSDTGLWVWILVSDNDDGNGDNGGKKPPKP